MINRVLNYCFLLFFTFSTLSGQSTSPQISFVAFNADGNDDFAFVALSNISANTTIYFSDNEVLNDTSLNSGEGILAWTNSGMTAAGSIVIISDASSSASLSSNLGSIQNISGNFNLSGSGDALIAYLGPNENVVSQWLCVIENSSNVAGDIAATNLIQNQAYIQFNQSSSPDGGYYNGPRMGESSFSNYAGLIQNPSNWHEEVSNGTAILPISNSPFSIASSSSAKLILKDFGNSLDTTAQQGDSLHLLKDFQLIAKNGNSLLLDMAFPFNGSMIASDFQSFQLRSITTGLAVNSSVLATLPKDSLLNDTLIFRNLNISLSANDTLILKLFAAIDSNANVNHTFRVVAPLITLSLGQFIDSLQNSFLHQIVAIKPQVLFSDFNFVTRIDSLAQDSSNHLMHAFQINSRHKTCSLVSLNALLQGNFQPSDVSIFKFWHSTDNTFNPANDQLLSVCNYIDSSGSIEFLGINKALQKNKLEHFFISIDLSCSAQVGNSLRISKLDSSYFKFDRSVETSGDASASAAIAIKELLAQNVESLNYQLQGTTLNLNWIIPSCVDEVLVLIHNIAINDTIYGQFNVNSNSFIDPINATLASGARAVYSGLFNSVAITDLSIGQKYYAKVFTRKGTKWSIGESFDFLLANSPSLIISQYYEGQSNDKWIEISNVGDTAINLGNFYLARWSNTSQPIASASSSNQLSGILAAGASILMQHSSASNPLYASGTSGGALAFNGDDALAICSDSPDWENRIDCIYSIGYWGENTSFFRKPWVLQPQRNMAVLDGSGEWVEVSNTIVDSAAIGTSARLGEHQSGLPTGDFTFNGTVWLPQNPQGLSTAQNSVVVQSGFATLNSDLNCSYLQVLNQAKLEVINGATLFIDDSIVNDGEITLANAASILQKDTSSSNPNSGGGIYKIKRSYQATATDRFKFWSSPLADAFIENSFANTNPLDRYYYQAGGLNPGYKSQINGKMKVARAYALTPNLPLNLQLRNFSDSVVFQGRTLNNGPVTVQIDSLKPGEYIFLGNPYPSSIDFNLFLAENPNIHSSIWYWDASPNDKGNSAFAVWNNQGAVSVGNSKKAAPTNIIPAMQGFIIRASQSIALNSQHSFVFKNSMRVSPANANTPFYKFNSQHQKVPLRLRSNKAESLCLIALDSAASQHYEEKVDAPIYKANQNQSFYSIADQKQLSIQTLNADQSAELIIPLGVDAWHLGNYSILLDSIGFQNNDLSIILIDSLTAFERDLKSQAYSFVINHLGSDTARFYLKLKSTNDLGVDHSLDMHSSFQAYQNQNGNLEIDLSIQSESYNKLQLSSLNSQIMQSWTLEPGQSHYELPLADHPAGIFLLSLKSSSGATQSFKIFLR
tara:strand:+ start:1475 stop:5542 length:4068 start_codon:yes stop_codon:yes gene_type:complete